MDKFVRLPTPKALQETINNVRLMLGARVAHGEILRYSIEYTALVDDKSVIVGALSCTVYVSQKTYGSDDSMAIWWSLHRGAKNEKIRVNFTMDYDV